ncbi:ATP-binding protein [Paenibacillus puldeungensis]|uniref:histidine kinase n=1 Tax=Paenibacillus puldeungensis TaxID=696536 RepID=A0ABW3RZY8_9BACL
MRRNRIEFKLGLIILSAFAVVLVSLGIAIDRMFMNFYNTEMKTEVEELTTHFATMAETPHISTEQTMLEFADFSNVSMLFVDPQGKVLAHSGMHSLKDHSFIRQEDVKQLFAGKSVHLQHTGPKGERYFVSAKAVPGLNGAKAKSAIYVLSSTQHMDESIAAVRRLIFLSGAGAFLLALGITWILAHTLSKPLLQIQNATRRIAEGELETRLEIRQNDEVGSLALEINHLAEELQRYRDTRQEFFANISHELRTPITYLEGYAKVIMDRLYETEEERDKYLEIIHQEALRLQHLVNDLFELAKMEEGKISLSLEWIDLAEIVGNAVRKIELKAGDKGLLLDTSIGSGIPLIYGDGLRMEQVLINLLENAVRYTEAGQIHVRLYEKDKHACLVVEDTGIGIPDDEIAYIFDRFYRVEKSRSRQYGGTGLGLPIAKKLVELLGGQMLVSSKVGVGTSFEIRFPLKEQGETV